MIAPIALLADIPAGDGPKRAHKRMRLTLARLARRIAVAAIVRDPQADILLEVYCAGIKHAQAELERQA